MVRINLISSEQAQLKRRKPLEIQNQLIIASVGLSILILALGMGWIILDRRIASLNTEITAKLAELEILKAQVAEVENYERDKKMVSERIMAIEELRAHQTIPVQLLDGISHGIPSRVWLVSLNESGGKVDIHGKSMTNGEIVDFVNALKKNPFFTGVELIESKQEKEMDVSVYSFKLVFSVVS